MNSNITSSELDDARIVYDGNQYDIENLFIVLWNKALEHNMTIAEFWQSECEKITLEKVDEQELEEMAEDGKAYNNIRDFRISGWGGLTYSLAMICGVDDWKDYVIDTKLIEKLVTLGVNLKSALRIAYNAFNNWSCGYGENYLENQGWRLNSVKSIEFYEGKREDLMSEYCVCFFIESENRTIKFALDCNWESESDMYTAFV
jgi:hypothetical protein